MKKIKTLFIVALLLICPALCFATGGQSNVRVEIWSSTTISASGSSTSSAVELTADEGAYGVQFIVTGSGTAKLEWYVSADGTNYIQPSGYTTTLTSSFTATSGTGADGKDYFNLAIPPAHYLKLKASETGGSSSITVKAILIKQ